MSTPTVEIVAYGTIQLLQQQIKTLKQQVIDLESKQTNCCLCQGNQKLFQCICGRSVCNNHSQGFCAGIEEGCGRVCNGCHRGGCPYD